MGLRIAVYMYHHLFQTTVVIKLYCQSFRVKARHWATIATGDELAELRAVGFFSSLI